MGKQPRRRRKRPVKWYDYYLEIMGWHSSGSNGRRIKVVHGERMEEERDEHLDISLDVNLLNPLKGVTRGHLEVTYSSQYEWYPNWEDVKVHDCGGYLWYRKRGDDQVMSGHVWASPHGVLHLQSLILAGQRVVICLHGHEFYRREALITNPTWFTYGHPDFMEDLAWEIEKALGKPEADAQMRV